MDPAALDATVAGLVEKLKLTEGKYLARAAVLLFHPDPQRFVTGAFVKIGFFRSESDLVYHDEVEGDLFGQVRQTMDLLLTKYLKARIYEDKLKSWNPAAGGTSLVALQPAVSQCFLPGR